MKREIKFRAWDKTSKSMIKDYAHIGMFGELVVTSFHDSAYSDSGCPNLTLLQSIGIKDKSGAEIYEGDIYKQLWRDEEIIGQIVYGDMARYWIEMSAFLSVGEIKIDGEVIGNIYENTNLINIVKG